MHCVSCMLSLSCFLQKAEREWRTAQRKISLSILSNPTLALRQHEQEQALSLLTCEERTRVNWGTGKAKQRVNASIRHMHREHSAYSNPTCALRAPFASHTFHSCFDLCTAKERSTQTPNEYSGDKATSTNAMHACGMTLAYLRGGLSTCSVVWVDFGDLSLKFIKIVMQLCKHFLQNFGNYGSYLLFQQPFKLAQPSF